MSSIHTEKGTTMRFTIIAVPFITAAGIAAASLTAPTAAAAAINDPCSVAVSTSRCLGPQGIDGFDVPQPRTGVMNGPYGSWGSVPPLG